MKEDITLNFNPIQTLGYLSCKLPSDVFETVQQEVDEILNSNFAQAKPYNPHLAGSIEHEYGLSKSIDLLNKFMNKVVPEYWRFVNEPSKCSLPLKIDSRIGTGYPSLWVNFQKKYEYNPIHYHTGILSFVIFVKIPYTMNNEKNLPRVTKSISSERLIPNYQEKIPRFSFIYPALAGNALVGEHNILIDDQYEGTLLLFPSWLQHAVTPFYTSDDYRITVAGNLYSE